jgi:hypothetical protein
MKSLKFSENLISDFLIGVEIDMCGGNLVWRSAMKTKIMVI